MANQAAKSSFEQPGLFGDDQGDLFGKATVANFTAYVPKEGHVRNALKRLVGEMEAADQWPWSKAEVRQNRDHWLEHLCSHLTDEAEANDWRKRIATNFARLEAAENTNRVV